MPSRSDEDNLKPFSGTFLDQASEAAATRVYLAVLRMAKPSRELLLAQGIPASVLDPALAVLQSRGFVHVAGNSLEVPPPMASIPQHAIDLERRAQQVRAAAHELTQVYYNARTRTHDDESGVRLLHDIDEVAAQTNVLVANALDGIVVSRGMTTRSRHLMGAPLESQREPTVGLDAREVRHRTIWDTTALELPGAIEVLRARAAGGEEQRYLSRVPLTFLVVDEAVCLVEWTSDDDTDDGPVGMVVHTRGLVAAATALFERTWELATPLNRGTAGDDIDRRDTTILRLMAAGVADASIARQTGVSQRTVERRIRSLMERLTAETRFQAGVQAVRRGWL